MKPDPFALREYLHRVQHWPFDWGRHDCLTFACYSIRRAWREDFTGMMGNYRDARGALEHYKVLKERYGDFGDLADRCLERVEGIARSCDLIGKPNPWTARRYGIYLDGVVYSPGKTGLVYEPLEPDDLVWRPKIWSPKD